MQRRRWASVCLIVVTCVLALVSTLALWLRALVLNTDSYVRAITPVLDDSRVRDSLAETIVDALYTNVDVTARLKAALPKSAVEFAPTLAASIRATSVQLASAALATAAARKVWQETNRVAHDQIVHVLEGKGTVLTTAKGEVAIDTGALADSVRATLHEHGVTLFDDVPTDALDQRFVLFRSTDLAHAQNATRALDELATWVPFVTVATGAAAVAAATRRRRAAEWLAVGVAGVMVVVAIGIAIGRSFYLARVGAAYRTIAAAPFDALVSPLRAWSRITFVVALGVALVAWLSESDTIVARERRARAVVLDFVRRYPRPLAVGGAALAAVLLIAWDKPRPLVVYTTLGVLGAWELLCAGAGRIGPHSGGTGTTPAPD